MLAGRTPATRQHISVVCRTRPQGYAMHHYCNARRQWPAHHSRVRDCLCTLLATSDSISDTKARLTAFPTTALDGPSVSIVTRRQSLPDLGLPRGSTPSPATGGRSRECRRRHSGGSSRTGDQPVLVLQPRADCRHPHPSLQLRGDVVVMHGESPTTSWRSGHASSASAPDTSTGPQTRVLVLSHQLRYRLPDKSGKR